MALHSNNSNTTTVFLPLNRAVKSN